jgi:hypothetical protein
MIAGEVLGSRFPDPRACADGRCSPMPRPPRDRRVASRTSRAIPVRIGSAAARAPGPLEQRPADSPETIERPTVDPLGARCAFPLLNGASIARSTPAVAVTIHNAKRPCRRGSGQSRRVGIATLGRSVGVWDVRKARRVAGLPAVRLCCDVMLTGSSREQPHPRPRGTG